MSFVKGTLYEDNLSNQRNDLKYSLLMAANDFDNCARFSTMLNQTAIRL